MDEAERHQSTAEIERSLLAALCASALDPQTRAEILELLAVHTYANPDHKVIFGALLKMPRASAQHIRETLSARLTLLGFPDIDVEPIFELAPPSPERIRTLLHQLSR